MTQTATPAPSTLDARALSRILDEGYGPGAWHGADLKAALADVPADLAFRRPAAGRHNVAEIALHHAYYVHSVRGRLSRVAIEPFGIAGDDWFALDRATSDWNEVQTILRSQYEKLADLLRRFAAGDAAPAADQDALALVLGITCHAVYHAGQIQLIKVLVTQ